MELCTNKDVIENLEIETVLSFPIVYGCFSLSGQNRTFSPDTKQLKYWNKHCPQEGEVQIDLNVKPDMNIRKDPEKPEIFLNNLLKYFMTHKRSFVSVFSDYAITLSESPIVCYRGCLRFISSLPYFPNESTFVACCLYRGVIYLYHIPEPEIIYEDRQKHIDWGHKFEQYMLANSPNSHPDLSKPLLQSEEFVCIFRADLDKHHLIYGAEVDGVIVEDENKNFSNFPHDQLISELNKSKFIELKTKNKIINYNNKITFSKYNTVKWWLQSYYGRNDIILCGFKNNKDGIVRDITKYDVMSLPDYSNGFWDAGSCLNFCNTFFSYVKNCLSQELNKLNVDDKNIRSAPKIEIMFERKAGSHLFKKCEKYPENYTLLPEWYIESFGDNQ